MRSRLFLLKVFDCRWFTVKISTASLPKKSLPSCKMRRKKECFQQTICTRLVCGWTSVGHQWCLTWCSLQSNGEWHQNDIFSGNQAGENMYYLWKVRTIVLECTGYGREKEANGRFKVSSDVSKICDLAPYFILLRSRKRHLIGLREAFGNRGESSGADTG